MCAKFAGSDAVEMAVQIEINGRDFYSVLEQNASDGKAGEIFALLKDEEEAHITAFKELLSIVQKYEPEVEYNEEYYAHMNALAGNHVFTQKGKGKEIAGTIKDDKQALDTALKFEQDSIVFYESMKRIVAEKDHYILNTLIGQEKNHVERLEAIKRDI